MNAWREFPALTAHTHGKFAGFAKRVRVHKTVNAIGITVFWSCASGSRAISRLNYVLIKCSSKNWWRALMVKQKTRVLQMGFRSVWRRNLRFPWTKEIFFGWTLCFSCDFSLPLPQIDLLLKVLLKSLQFVFVIMDVSWLLCDLSLKLATRKVRRSSSVVTTVLSFGSFSANVTQTVTQIPLKFLIFTQRIFPAKSMI